MEKLKKTLCKSSKTNMLSTFYELNGNCGGCGTCGCSCYTELPWFNLYEKGRIEAEYRTYYGVS
jgi:CO dehydrogenase/acetyl-CoA synthase alpha subunit